VMISPSFRYVGILFFPIFTKIDKQADLVCGHTAIHGLDLDPGVRVNPRSNVIFGSDVLGFILLEKIIIE
jgi:hypothetical protein